VATGEKNAPTLAERLHRLRDQAEQLTREIEQLEKETVKK
jgi:prefoldin subunit 5